LGTGARLTGPPPGRAAAFVAGRSAAEHGRGARALHRGDASLEARARAASRDRRRRPLANGHPELAEPRLGRCSGMTAALPDPATSSPSWPASFPSASSERASFPCSSSCSCPCSPCSTSLWVRLGYGPFPFPVLGQWRWPGSIASVAFGLKP